MLKTLKDIGLNSFYPSDACHGAHLILIVAIDNFAGGRHQAGRSCLHQWFQNGLAITSVNLAIHHHILHHRTHLQRRKHKHYVTDVRCLKRSCARRSIIPDIFSISLSINGPRPGILSVAMSILAYSTCKEFCAPIVFSIFFTTKGIPSH